LYAVDCLIELAPVISAVAPLSLELSNLLASAIETLSVTPVKAGIRFSAI
jgi:hypothetical protein